MKEIAKKIRRKTIKMLYEAQGCHLGSCMSCVEILVALYFGIMKPGDHFILSKGHAVATLYAILTEKGILPEEKLSTYLKEGGLPGHVTRGIPGIEVSTGSLGHGLPIGCGMALADRTKRVYVLMSDGEMQEGSTWESALFASQNRLDNLVAIVDNNKFSASRRTDFLEPLAEKWRKFGWWVADSIKGHDIGQLELFLKLAGESVSKPSCIICDTLKGKGIPFLENKLESHYHILNKKEFDKSLSKM